MTRHYEDTDTRRRQVAKAALRTIVEDGSRFTTKAVADRAGISHSTLFRHFGSKVEIVLEAMSLLEAEMEAGLQSTDDTMADLEAFFRHRAAFVGADTSVGRLIFSDDFVHLAGEIARRRIQVWRAKSVLFLAQRLRKLQADSIFRPDLDIAAMNTFFQGTLLTFAMQASLGNSSSDKDLDVRIDKAWLDLQLILAK